MKFVLELVDYVCKHGSPWFSCTELSNCIETVGVPYHLKAQGSSTCVLLSKYLKLTWLLDGPI